MFRSRCFPFDSWFLNGTNLVSDEGPFNSNDWQTGDLPVFTEGGPPLVENTINWSRSLQAIDPMNGLTSSGNEAQIATFPGNTSSEPIFSAFLAIHNPGSGVFGSNRIQQDDPFFNLGFTPTSTEFTPVPEPRIYVSFAMIGLSVLFCIRRVRALEQELPSEESS